MGTETAPSATDGTIIPAAHVNTLADMMQGDFVPRNSSGAPTDIAGALGSTSYAWLKAFIESGYWNIGDIKPHHTYNGTAPVGHGWMLCDGGIINETNYNTFHGAGSWSTYVGSSGLDGLYTPDLTGSKYLTGSATTPQDGSSLITTIGVSGSQLNLQHNHKWYQANGLNADGQTYNSSGILTAITEVAKNLYKYIAASQGNTSINDGYTENQLTSPQDIKPESIEVQYFIRII